MGGDHLMPGFGACEGCKAQHLLQGCAVDRQRQLARESVP